MPDEVRTAEKELDVSGEVPALEGEEHDQALLQGKDLFSTFVKTIKAFRLYPPENPSLVSFRDQIFRKFQEFLKHYHSFFVKVNEYTLSFHGKTIYENRDLKTSLAFLMYKDGLRELRFMEGLELWELEGLIDILKRTEFINQMEDDLVTLLWEKDFVHISYLATDVFLDEMAGIIPENVDQFRQNLIFDPSARYADVDILDEEDLDSEKDYYELLSQKAERPPAIDTNRNVYFLTPEELERLRKEVDSEVSANSVFNVIDILFEILAIEKNKEPFQDAVGMLMKLLDALLTLGEFQRASDLLTRANIILKTYELKDWQVEIVQGLIQYGGDAERLERICSFLGKGHGVRWEEVNAYLLLLTPRSIPPLIKALGEMANSKARRLLCDVIVHLGKNHLEQIIPFIDDQRWYLVRNIAYVLGRIGKEQALPAIQKGMSHREVRVRREAVQALGFIGGPKALGLLVKALSDEDVRVRSIAALNLAKVGKDESQPYLLDIIRSKEFSKKEPAEKKAFLDAMGMVDPNFSLQAAGKKGSPKVVPVVSKVPVPAKPPPAVGQIPPTPRETVREPAPLVTKPVGEGRREMATPVPAKPPPAVGQIPPTPKKTVREPVPLVPRPGGGGRREMSTPLRIVSAKRPVALKQSGLKRMIRRFFRIFSPSFKAS